jgi:TolB protein
MTRERELEHRGDSLFARDADGRMTFLAAGPEIHSPAWSSDGSRLAFVRGNREFILSYGLGNVATSEIWVVPVGGAPVRVTDGGSLNLSPAWLPDGRLLFISDREGPRDVYLARLNRSGALASEPVRLTTGLEPFSLSVSADGSTLAYDRFRLNRNIFTLPIPTSGAISIRRAEPLPSVNQVVEGIGISRDGRWLAFDSNLDGAQQIYVMPASGGEPRRVTSDPVGAFAPDFSPDGLQIAFHSQRHATRDIYVVNVDGTGEQRVTDDSAESFQPSFSPDGLHLAYLNNPPHGVYLLRRDSVGGRWRSAGLLASGAGVPRWSPEGSRLVFGAPRRISILMLNGTIRTLYEQKEGAPRSARWPEWSQDGRTIYFRATGPDGVDGLYAIPSAGGSPRRVVSFDDPRLRVGGPAVTIGNGLFYLPVAEMESDIYIMDVTRR